MMMTLDQTVAALSTQGTSAVLHGAGAPAYDGVSIDSRTLRPGELYVALRGERFDGHDFGAAAAGGGARGLLVERLLALGNAVPAIPQIVVPDTRAALGALGSAWRRRFDIPLIGVAGSNGKTTTTQMIGAIFDAAFGARTGATGGFATRGNRNNEIGVPLMLLELRAGHRAAVLELGMNHPGEIARLGAWARPTIGVVTNAQREHQEFLDSVEATARENGALIAALPPQGTAVFPADDACAPVWRALAGDRRVLDFALEGPAALRAEATLAPEASRLRLQWAAGTISTELALGGRHNVRNAAAAAAAALAAGIAPDAIAAGLAAFRPVSGRGTRRHLPDGLLLIDETYNANPDSVRAAIDLLAGHGGMRILVLGDMGEVGSQGAAFHREVGAYARERGIEHLLTVGELAALAAQAFGAAARHCRGIDEVVAGVRAAAAGAAASVLVKGSRFMRLERVVAALAGPGAAAPGGVPHA